MFSPHLQKEAPDQSFLVGTGSGLTDFRGLSSSNRLAAIPCFSTAKRNRNKIIKSEHS